jgi:hypothetical protein
MGQDDRLVSPALEDDQNATPIEATQQVYPETSAITQRCAESYTSSSGHRPASTTVASNFESNSVGLPKPTTHSPALHE